MQRRLLVVAGAAAVVLVPSTAWAAPSGSPVDEGSLSFLHGVDNGGRVPEGTQKN